MTTNWHYPPETPKEGEAVWCQLEGNVFAAMKYCYVDDAEGRVWVRAYIEPDWDPDCEFYTSTYAEWDDDYTVIRWHRYPDPREEGKKQ